MTGPLKIFICAGEESGDILGGALMQALQQQAQPPVSFTGVGGQAMQEQGLRSLFPMEELSVMGVFEVLPRLPKLLRRISQTAQAITREQPDIVITIDSPDFSFRVVRKALSLIQTKKPRFFHYVAPTVWAWRPERAAKLAKLYDGVLCLFPFEPPYFEKEGMQAAFVGHTVMQSAYDTADGKALRKQLGIPEQVQLIGFLPGSRKGELKRMGPVLRDVALEMMHRDPQMHLLCLTLPHLKDSVQALLGADSRIHIINDRALKGQAFAAMDAALATSGTVGLELSVADVSHIIAYKMNALTYHLIKGRVTTKYAHLTNILLDQHAVPEFIQNDCKVDNILPVAQGLFDDLVQKQAFEKTRALLTGADTGEPATQAAQFILKSG